MKKINCGGFYIDENDFNIDEEEKLSLNGGGGSAFLLPPVTAVDDGKVLGVDDGGWKAMEAPAGMEEITYSALKALRDGGNLVHGRAYRITDYVTIINGAYDLSAIGASGYIHYAQSAGHPFDIIVIADDESHLNENARAVLHSGDTYFANSKLEAWEIKYALDNDPTRFAWADSTNGKGVVWWMRDEFNNEAGYDFKNTQILCYALAMADQSATPNSLCYDASTQPNRYGSVYAVFTALRSYMSDGSYINPFTNGCDFAVGYNILGTVQFPTVDATYLATFNADWYYTFDSLNSGVHSDKSLNGGKLLCYNNKIALCEDSLAIALSLPVIPLGLNGSCWQDNDKAISHDASSNNLARGCVMNIFGANCWGNCFGDASFANVFANDCMRNVFGPNCDNNSFGSGCDSNTFGRLCYSNVFGNDCEYNSFDNACRNNTFGNYCYSIYFWNNCAQISLIDPSSTNAVRNIRVWNISTGECDLFDPALSDKSYPIDIGLDSQGRLVASWWNGLTREGMYKAAASDSWHTLT